MLLRDIQRAFETALLEPVRVFEEIATTKTFSAPSDFTTDDLCLLEGVLSRTWQIWCRFCRSLIMESCRGTQEISGAIVPAIPKAISEDLVSGAAIQAKLGRRITWSRANTILRNEPTWGDVDVLLDIANGLRPGNLAKIISMCTMASSGAKLIQMVRNASAHDNHQSLNGLTRFGTAYAMFPIDHACQALFWVEHTTTNYMLPYALEQLDAAVKYVVQ